MTTKNIRKVDRHITFFDKKSEKCAGEIMINEIPLKDLTDLVTLEMYQDDYLLYDCYLLNKVMLEKLSQLTKKPLEYDVKKYDYFLEASAAD